MTMTYVEIRVRLQMTSIFSPFLVTLCSGGVLWVFFSIRQQGKVITSPYFRHPASKVKSSYNHGQSSNFFPPQLVKVESSCPHIHTQPFLWELPKRNKDFPRRETKSFGPRQIQLRIKPLSSRDHLPKEIKMETRHLTEAASRRRRTKISRLNVNQLQYTKFR